MPRVPKAGDTVTMEDFEMILEAVKQRQKNFPDEPASMTFAMIFMGIGDRFTPVTCKELEWEGVKQDIPKGTDTPFCPNGHRLIMGPKISLGWVEEK